MQASRQSCSATAMAGSSRCKWRSVIPILPASLVLADCGAAFSEPGREAFRNMAAASKAKGLAAITDVAMRRLFAPDFQAAHPDLMADRRAAFLKTDPDVFRAACDALADLDLRPELAKVKVPVLVLVGEHDEATPPPMSHELAAGLPQAQSQDHCGLRACPAVAIAAAVPGDDRRFPARGVFRAGLSGSARIEVHRRGIAAADDDGHAFAGCRPICAGQDRREGGSTSRLRHDAQGAP